MSASERSQPASLLFNLLSQIDKSPPILSPGPHQATSNKNNTTATTTITSTGHKTKQKHSKKRPLTQDKKLPKKPKKDCGKRKKISKPKKREKLEETRHPVTAKNFL
jgi:hypothetical protein